ncbi:MAG: FG-GAP-like repeat-containing protein [Planctomycetota bacterium]
MNESPSALLRLLVTVALVMLVCMRTSLATDFFVRTSGDDTNDGLSAETAWRTLSKAASSAQSGDTVYIGAGVYEQQLRPSHSGQPGGPVRFIADTTGVHTGDLGPVTVRHADTPVFVRDREHIEFSGLAFDGLDGTRVVFVERSENIAFRYCSTSNATTAHFEVRTDSTVRIDSCAISGSARYGIDLDGAELTLVNSSLTGSSTTGSGIELHDATATLQRVTIDGWGIGINNDNSALAMTNCVVTGAARDGIELRKANASLTMWHGTVANNGDDGISAWGGNVEVFNSIIANHADDGIAPRNGTALTETHNLFFSNGGGDIPSRQIDETSLQADPRFELGSLQLASDSPAIDAGQDAAGVTSVDRLGVERPLAGAYDLGAYEHVSTRIPATVPYFTDFEAGVDAAWDDKRVRHTSFLGTFHGLHEKDGSTSILVLLAPGERYVVVWDLIIDGTWDGKNGSLQDWFYLEADGEQLFAETFSRNRGLEQTWPVEPEATGNALGLGTRGTALYTSVSREFEATNGLATITWRSDVTGSDEIFGIDNVRIVHADDASPFVPIFVDVSGHTGFDAATGGGLHPGDFNGDGRQDVLLTTEPPRLLLQGANAFTPLVPTPSSIGAQCALLDADHDGDLDVLTARHGTSAIPGLFINDGGGNFDLADPLEWEPRSTPSLAIAGDFDDDGRADAVITSAWGNDVARGNRSSEEHAFEQSPPSLAHLNDPRQSGTAARLAVADVNNDGRIDLLHHGTGALGLYLSGAEGHDPRAIPAFTSNAHDLDAQAAWGDYDNDGDLDLYLGNTHPGDHGTLWRNDLDPATGAVSFTEITAQSGLTDVGALRTADWGDYDNDGDLDLYVGTVADDIADEAAKNLLFENQGDGTFARVSLGASIPAFAFDAAFIDYDNDGDLDLAIARTDAPNTLLRNETDSDNYLKVRVIGGGPGRTNTAAIGVRVELFDSAGAFVARRDIGAASGFGGGSFVAHFGGVDPQATYAIRAHMARGRTLEASVVPALTQSVVGPTVLEQTHTFVEPSGGLGRIVSWQEKDTTQD